MSDNQLEPCAVIICGLGPNTPAMMLAARLAEQGYRVPIAVMEEAVALTRSKQTEPVGLRELQEVVAYFVSRERSIKIDIGSAHKARGAGASDFMREDDADFRRELEAAFDKARAAIASLKGNQHVG